MASEATAAPPSASHLRPYRRATAVSGLRRHLFEALGLVLLATMRGIGNGTTALRPRLPMLLGRADQRLITRRIQQRAESAKQLLRWDKIPKPIHLLKITVGPAVTRQ